MGTVGLNFGSPTSGTGFNVSTTVAEIVSNLQNVETPWKTQLTSLASQDTAISSLGTLFSNLSNDMSSLTDAEGILSEKTGSSSNTNVLTLTAATNSAVAGTHTVTVTNLAQTSSGYLAPIKNADGTLTGSVTLAAGSGTAQTFAITSADNTLSGLASTINSSGVGITASVLTDSSGSRLSLVSSTSGGDGNITVSANSIAASDQILGYTGTAGSTGVASTGTLATVGSSTDTLTGSIVIQMGSGTAETVVLGDQPVSGAAANTIYTGTSVNTLSTLASTIQSNATSLGFTAATNTAGTILSLTAGTTGSASTLTVTSSIVDTGSSTLGYSNTVTGKDANLTVDGIALTSASNTVANLIPGITLQLLAPSTEESDGSLEQVQVVIGNDNSDVESTVGQMVSDYNSLISAMNTQDGNTSSGTPEPLYGSPTLTLLQQQLLGGLNMTNPNGSLTSISTAAGTTLAGSMSITVGSGTAENFVFGVAPSSPAANTVYTGSGVNTLSGMASAINKASIGVTAAVVTSNGESTLTLTSQTSGASGALTVSSSIVASGPTALSFTDTYPYTSTTADVGTIGSAAALSDVLSGSVTIRVGSGTAQIVDVPPHSATSPSNNLSGLAGAINAAKFGVTALVVTNVGTGVSSIKLTSGTVGSAGALSVSSKILDTTGLTNTTLNYTNSSDINSLTTLGVSVNDDGTMTFDAASLDSVLNSDYSSVAGFFQNANSWGQSFSTMLTNAGTVSGTGILALASTSNSNIESTLNADISKEGLLISAQQSSLTTELNQANEIMQQLPTELEGVNELYSAVTGYDQNAGG
jgi:flagellar hook-associated protein 2